MLTFTIINFSIKNIAIGFGFQKPISVEAQSVIFLLTQLIYDLILHVVHYEPCRLGQIAVQSPIQGQ